MIKLKDFIGNGSKDPSLETIGADMPKRLPVKTTMKYFDPLFEAAVDRELGDPMPAVFKDPTNPGPQFLQLSNQMPVHTDRQMVEHIARY